MEIDCEHCGSSFSSKTNLITHQKTSKYCLNLRGETVVKYSCAACGDEFTRASSLERHNDVCKIALSNLCHEIEMSRLLLRLKKSENRNKKLIKKLKKANDKLTARNTVPSLIPATTTKTDLKLADVNVSSAFTCSISEIPLRLANKEYVFDGIEGLLTFITPTIKQDDFKCYVRTDPTRLHYHRYAKGKWTKDPNALFIREILDAMIPHVKECAVKYVDVMKTLDDEERLDKWKEYMEIIEPFCHKIIRFDSKERNVLIKDIANRLSYITDKIG